MSLDLASRSIEALAPSAANDVSLRASASAEGVPLRHHWSLCVGAGRANEGLRANWLEHLQLVEQHCGFRYVRMHGIFHDDMFVCSVRDGRLAFNWQYIDELFDRMLDLGVRPFVELGWCPRDLASVLNTCFWWNGHGSPPKDLAQFGELVEAFVAHCIDRYGRDEVLEWYFEVWNEPNLSFFFQGTKAQYFELYAESAKAVKRVDPRLRVGGPATSNFVPDERFDGQVEDTDRHATWSVGDLNSLSWKGVWIEEFLEFCRERELPLDFLSTHPYPTDFAIGTGGESHGRSRPVDSVYQDIQWLRRALASSAYPDAEIHLTEWSSSPDCRDHTHDYLQAATYVVKANLRCAGLIDSMSYWTFTDVVEEHGPGDTAFHGGFGMVSFQGVVKPVFHAYRFLNSLGDEELVRTSQGIVTRQSSTGSLQAIVWNYPEAVPDAPPMSNPTRVLADRTLALGCPLKVSVELHGLPPNAMIEVETLDAKNGDAVEAWRRMGSPEPPDRDQTIALRRDAMATRRERFSTGEKGVFHYRREIEPWSVVLIRQA